MRRFLSLSLVLTLTACIPIPVRIGDPSQRTSVQVTGVALLAQQIRAALTRLRDEIPARRAKLRRVPCESGFCYSADEIDAAVAQLRRDIQAAFPEEALASRISLDQDIAKISMFGTFGAKQSQSSIRLVRNRGARVPMMYDSSAVDAVFGGIQRLIDEYLAHDQLNPTLRFTSEPDGVTCVIQIGSNARTKQEVLTNNEIQSVWRGKYTGTARKRGYRDATGFPVDLMNDRRTKVRCKLVRVNADPSEESTCRLTE